jgi:hypothetical protein
MNNKQLLKIKLKACLAALLIFMSIPSASIAAVIWENSESFFLSGTAVAVSNLTYGPVGYTNIFGVQQWGSENDFGFGPTLASSLVDGGNFHHGALSVVANHGDIIGPSTEGMSPYTWLSNGDNYLGISFFQNGISGSVYYGWMKIVTTGIGTTDPNPTFRVVETAYENTGSAIAVPEPSALSLLAIGLGGLAMIRRRRS